MTDDPIGEYLSGLPLIPCAEPSGGPTGAEIMANIRRVQHLLAPHTLFTSREDAPGVMLVVEADRLIGDRVQVQGSPILPPDMAFLVDPRFMPPLPARSPDPLMSGDAMDLDAAAPWRSSPAATA